MRCSRLGRHPAVLSFALAGWLALLVSGCSGSSDPGEGGGGAADPAQARQEVIEAHRSLVEAYQKADVEAFALLLDKTDDLLIYHPRRQDRWHGILEAQQSLERMFEEVGKSVWLDVHLDVSVEGDVAWLTSHVVIESPSVELPFTGRGTEVWVRRAAGWKLAHGHWSANPEFEAVSSD